MKRTRGFTLIETLLAAALLGALLLALNFFVFSMAEIWGAGSERRLFEQHVRAVTREVETLLRTAALPPLNTDTPIFGREIRLDDGRRVTPVSFELAEGSPRLPWKTAPLPDVVCGLVAQPNKGLTLYWQSRLEKNFDDAAPRPFVLSPFGAELKYEYLEGDGAVWRVYDQLQRDNQGRWRMPVRLRLAFAHGTMKAETTVTLPPAPGPLPHY
jgi:prepilin-type N-terminal cleavage/methylation domain-containing protein